MNLTEDRVDIIIPFYPSDKGKVRLERLKKSLEEVDAGFPYRLVVAENKERISVNRNLGLKNSDTRFYLACDDDVIFLEKNWLLKAMNKMREDPLNAVVGFRTVDANGNTTNAGRVIITEGDVSYDTDYRHVSIGGVLVDITKDAQINIVPGCCMLVDRLAAGYYAENLYLGKINCEDVDHQLQIQMNGFKIQYLGSVTVFHDNNNFCEKVEKYSLKKEDALNHATFMNRWKLVSR